MYFIFKPVLRTWRNQTIQAALRTNLPLMNEVKPHWWLAKPIQTSLPTLTFSINKNAPLFDNYRTDWGFDLYSEKLVKLFEGVGVKFEIFPATIIDNKTKQVLPLKYYVFHLLEMYPCADIKASEIGGLVLTDDCIQAGYPLFRLAEGIQIVLIHDSLKSVLEEAGITGCQFNSLNEYRNTPLFPPQDFRV